MSQEPITSYINYFVLRYFLGLFWGTISFGATFLGSFGIGTTENWNWKIGLLFALLSILCLYTFLRCRIVSYHLNDISIGNNTFAIRDIEKVYELGYWKITLWIKIRGRWYFTPVGGDKRNEIEILRRKVTWTGINKRPI